MDWPPEVLAYLESMRARGGRNANDRPTNVTTPAFSPVERAAMDAILANDIVGMDIARQQYQTARITHREFTGTGVFTTFAVSEIVPRLPNVHALRQVFMEGVVARVDGDPEEVILFKIWERAGQLCSLEGFTMYRPWPEDEACIRVAKAV